MQGAAAVESFGFSPKISTPVENIVEKQVKGRGADGNALI
jgi:hypothetical protein